MIGFTNNFTSHDYFVLRKALLDERLYWMERCFNIENTLLFGSIESVMIEPIPVSELFVFAEHDFPIPTFTEGYSAIKNELAIEYGGNLEWNRDWYAQPTLIKPMRGLAEADTPVTSYCWHRLPVNFLQDRLRDTSAVPVMHAYFNKFTNKIKEQFVHQFPHAVMIMHPIALRDKVIHPKGTLIYIIACEKPINESDVLEFILHSENSSNKINAASRFDLLKPKQERSFEADKYLPELKEDKMTKLRELSDKYFTEVPLEKFTEKINTLISRLASFTNPEKSTTPYEKELVRYRQPIYLERLLDAPYNKEHFEKFIFGRIIFTYLWLVQGIPIVRVKAFLHSTEELLDLPKTVTVLNQLYGFKLFSIKEKCSINDIDENKFKEMVKNHYNGKSVFVGKQKIKMNKVLRTFTTIELQLLERWLKQ